MRASDTAKSQNARRAWERKASLRAVYKDVYRRLAEKQRPGPTIEIGGGSGNFKNFAPETISTDIIVAPWLDAVADAVQLPFADASVANIVLFDVLPHIEFPVRFLDEAARVLAPGGRVLLSEPAITPLSNLFYTHLHPEPVDAEADVFVAGTPNPNRDPFDANQAIPTLMFLKQRERFRDRFPIFDIVDVRYHSLLAYPLTGGFRKWTVIPATIVPAMLSLESVFMPLLGRLMAFRLIVTIERRN